MSSLPAVLVESELFASQMAKLGDAEREMIWQSLARARDGKPTPGVESPWGAGYLLWPCGPHKEFKVLLRRLDPDEVEALAGDRREGFYLYRVEG